MQIKKFSFKKAFTITRVATGALFFVSAFSPIGISWAQGENCFSQVKIEPGFIAFTQSEYDVKTNDLGAWYKKQLDLKL